MIYYLLRPLVRISFFTFYQKIHCTGRDAVIKKGPILFTANHPTAFIEPCFLACFSGRTLHFMTRGDIFSSQFLRWILAQVHLIPIYRFVDGYKGLRQNERSLDQAKSILSKCGAVLIMAEGRMAHEKRLRPIQKGAARIGLEAMVIHNLPEVYIQPVAINYTYADLAQTEIMVDFAPPFPLSPFVDLYRVNPKVALELVTSQIEMELAQRVIHIAKHVDELVAERVLQIVRNTEPKRFWPIFSRDKKPLLAELKAIQALNQLDQSEMDKLKSKIDPYFERLELLRIDDLTVALAPIFRSGSNLKYYLMLFLRNLLLVPHVLPLIFARWVTKRTVKIIEFRSSVLMGSSLFSWIIYATAIILITSMTFSLLMGLLAFTFLIATGAIIIWLDSKVAYFGCSAKWKRIALEYKPTLRTNRLDLIAIFKQLRLL